MDGSSASSSGGILIPLFVLALVVFMIVCMWKVFTKAGQPGWACIVPIYNLYVMLQIAGKPAWWLVLFFIPLANLVAMVLLNIAIAERFGKSMGFGIGLVVLGVIFFPILAFGDAQYQSPPA